MIRTSHDYNQDFALCLSTSSYLLADKARDKSGSLGGLVMLQNFSATDKTNYNMHHETNACCQDRKSTIMFSPAFAQGAF